MTKSIAQTIRDKKADPGHVALRDAGLVGAEGVITRQGRFVLRAFLLDKYETELVAHAKAYLTAKSKETN